MHRKGGCNYPVHFLRKFNNGLNRPNFTIDYDLINPRRPSKPIQFTYFGKSLAFPSIIRPGVLRMRLDELSWFDVESYLHQDNRLIFVLGSCEQHGYLSLLTDVKIPLALADAASKQTGVLIAPPQNYGASPYFLAYPGTLSLRTTTLLDIVEDLIRSAFRQGFRRFLFLNGHGGNDSARSRIYEVANSLPDMRVAWYTWWQAQSVELVTRKHGLRSYHAGWIEAFPFTRVGDLPEGEKTPPRVPGLMGAEEVRMVYGDGVFGGPYSLDEEILGEVFEAALLDIKHLLNFE
jgi:creatinine amidohydrolase